MEVENFESAASFVNRYLNIDQSILEESDSKKLRASQEELKTIIHKKLDQAIKDGNDKEILR